MSVMVATDEASLASIAEIWDRLAPASPHASRRLFTLVQSTSGGTARPHVVVIDRPGREPILIAARLEQRPLQIRAGYRTLLRVPARWLAVVAGGVVGAQSPTDYDLALRTLLAELRPGVADILHLAKVEVGGPLEAAARRQVPGYRRSQSAAPMTHHRSDLSAGFDAFCAARSKNTRWRLRKRIRRLADPAAKITVHRVDAADDPVAACRLIDAIAAKSYQRRLGVGFVDDELHRELMAWAVAGGPFHAWTLAVDGVPVAFLTGIRHERTFYLFDTAFDPAAEADEPGSLLLAHVLAELADSDDVDAFDYGYGDAQYKQTMSDMAWVETDIHCYARRPLPLALNAMATSLAVSVELVKRTVGPERIARLRRRRRQQLSAQEPDE